MDTQAAQYKKLIERYSAGETSPEENAWLESWYLQLDQGSKTLITQTELGQAQSQMWENVQAKTSQDPAVQKQADQPVIKLWQLLTRIAAVFAIACTVAIYFYHRNAGDDIPSRYANDIAPGTNGATLTLAGGQKIILDSVSDGQLATQTGVAITKTKDGQLIYSQEQDQAEANTNKSNNNSEYNILSTDKGQTYQVRLPDGSRVWLNAASSLKYPASFANQSQRRVELSGEAYFEISRDKEHPFIVKTEKQRVEVLGTHFNISSYPDEAHITTLLEGSVRLSANQDAKPGTYTNSSKEQVIKPGQQATLNTATAGFSIKAIDAQDAIAWKQGLFLFQDESLESIMKKVARWYNVEISYDGADKNKLFIGGVSRFDNISSLLQVLESTKGVHFKIEGRRVTVMK